MGTVAPVTIADKFEEKFNIFVDNANTCLQNTKTPAYLKPFLESIITFAQDVSNVVNELEGCLVLQKAVTDILATDRTKIQENLAVVTDELNEQLQNRRRNMVLIHGVEEKGGKEAENTDKIAMEVFAKINVPIVEKQINRSHRLGPRKRNSNDKKKRPIIVSFCSYKEKKLVYDAKKLLKSTGITITESLTKNRYTLYQQCQETYGYKNVWTYDGRIWCCVNDTKFSIAHEVDLAEMRQ